MFILLKTSRLRPKLIYFKRSGVYTNWFLYVHYIAISLREGPVNFYNESEAFFSWLVIRSLFTREAKNWRGLEPGYDVLTTCKTINTYASQRYLSAAEDLCCCSWCLRQIFLTTLANEILNLSNMFLSHRKFALEEDELELESHN